MPQGRGGGQIWGNLTTEFWKSGISKFQIRPYSKRTCVRCPWPLPPPPGTQRSLAAQFASVATLSASPASRPLNKTMGGVCTIQWEPGCFFSLPAHLGVQRPQF